MRTGYDFRRAKFVPEFAFLLFVFFFFTMLRKELLACVVCLQNAPDSVADVSCIDICMLNGNTRTCRELVMIWTKASETSCA